MLRFLFMILTVFVSLLWPLAAQASAFGDQVADMAEVKAVRIGASSDHVRIVVDATKELTYSTMVLSIPGRIVINLANTWLSPEVSRETVIGSRFASKVRVAQFDKTTVRIVIETNVKKGNYDVFAISGGAVPYRVVMDFGKIGTGSAENGEAAPETPKAETPKSDTPAAGSSTGSSTGTTTTTAEPPTKAEPVFEPGVAGKTIVIDPGHGGEDSGAIGPTGVTEKSITLRIAKEVQRLLTASGAKVVMTRSIDTEVSPKHRDATDIDELQARCDVANKAKADIFLSIHMDSFTSGDARGTTGYYYSKGTAAGRRLAAAIEAAVVSRLRTDDRGTKSCNFYVVKHTDMPATLVEVAFVSNPAEEKLMNSNAGIQKAAQGIADGIADFFGK